MKRKNIILQYTLLYITGYILVIFIMLSQGFMYLKTVKLKQDIFNIEFLIEKDYHIFSGKKGEYLDTWYRLKEYSILSGIDGILLLRMKGDQFIKRFQLDYDKKNPYEDEIGALVRSEKLITHLKKETGSMEDKVGILKPLIFKGEDQKNYLINFYFTHDNLGNKYIIALGWELQRIFTYVLRGFSEQILIITFTLVIFFVLTRFLYRNLKQNADLLMRDDLTGFYTRSYLKYLKRQVEKSPYSWGIIYIDLDNLKSINDRYGHEQGDYCIIQFSKFIKSYFRENEDHFLRIGGDEFIIFLPNIEKKELQSLSERLRKRKSEDIDFSIGIEHIDRCFGKKDDLSRYIKKADERMYEDKKMKKDADKKSSSH